jgi:CelD/BcsL family acetyltransferase involved in cellulose biosynthesis
MLTSAKLQSEGAAGNLSGVTELCPDRTVLADLQWQILDRLEDCESTFGELAKAGNPHPFSSYLWFKTWYDILGRHKVLSIRCVLVHYQGQPVLLFPIGLQRRFGVKILVWLASDWSDYCFPLVAKSFAPHLTTDVTQQMWAKVLDLLNPDIVNLRKQPATVNGVANRLLFPISFEEADSAFSLRLLQDTSALFASLHSRKTWHGYERKLRRLATNGALNFENVEKPDEKARSIEIMLNWKRVALGARGSRNPFSDKNNSRFLSEIAKLPAEICQVYRLTVGEKPVAIALMLLDSDSYLLYQISFDPDFEQQSPGTLLIHHLIKSAAERDFSIFDFSYGNDAYKVAICDQKIPMMRSVRYPTWRGKLIAPLYTAKIKFMHSLKLNAGLYALALRCNRTVRKILGR